MPEPEIPSQNASLEQRAHPSAEVQMNYTSLRDDGETTTCACGVCGRQFQPVGRQRFCAASCRQKAWRRRHPTPLPAIPARVPLVATVYVCTECDTRYLGEQLCPDCHRFCKRVGVGGSCPHCGEAVAVAELIE